LRLAWTNAELAIRFFPEFDRTYLATGRVSLERGQTNAALQELAFAVQLGASDEIIFFCCGGAHFVCVGRLFSSGSAAVTGSHVDNIFLGETKGRIESVDLNATYMKYQIGVNVAYLSDHNEDC
jgi:hypothetical protein